VGPDVRHGHREVSHLSRLVVHLDDPHPVVLNLFARHGAASHHDLDAFGVLFGLELQD